MTCTHTYAKLALSRAAYDEIARKLRGAGYDHAFNCEIIDMHGIAVTPEPEPKRDALDLSFAWAASDHHGC